MKAILVEQKQQTPNIRLVLFTLCLSYTTSITQLHDKI